MKSLQKTQQVKKQGNTTTFTNTRRTPRTSGLGQMSPERKVEIKPTQARPAPRCQKIRKGTSGCLFFIVKQRLESLLLLANGIAS